MAKDRRVIMRIELSPAAKEHFTNLPHRNGMTQLAVTSRLTEWFCRQSPEIQRGILIDYANGEQNGVALTKLILKRIAG